MEGPAGSQKDGSRTAAEKLMSIFSDIRAGEMVSVFLLAVTIFLLLGAYYLLKPVREALILSESGAEVRSYSAAGQAVLFLGLLPLYGWLGSRVNRVRLISGLTLFFVFNLVVFWFLGIRGVREGVVFYIWLGAFIVFMVSQFWAFANDLYTEDQGRRLFPLIGIGMSVGALAGSSTVSLLIKKFSLGPYALMLIAAGILVVCLILILTVNAREAAGGTPEARRAGRNPLGREGGFQLILEDRYLFWIASTIILLNVVNTTGEYILSKLVMEEVGKQGGDAKVLISQFYSSFYSMTNVMGLILQALATSRIFSHVGVRGAMFILPLVAFGSYSLLALAPVLVVVRWIKVLENGIDYSIMNTVRHALWLSTSRESKYKAKAVVDTFCTRGGDVLQAGIVYVGTSLGAGIAGFSWICVALTLAWLVAAGQIYIEHRRRTEIPKVSPAAVSA